MKTVVKNAEIKLEKIKLKYVNNVARNLKQAETLLNIVLQNAKELVTEEELKVYVLFVEMKQKLLILK